MAPGPTTEAPAQQASKPKSSSAVHLSLLVLSVLGFIFCIDILSKHSLGWEWSPEFDLQGLTRLGPHRGFLSSSRANFLLPKSTDSVLNGVQPEEAAEHATKSSFRHRVLGAAEGSSGPSESNAEEVQLQQCPYETSVPDFVPVKLAPHVQILGRGRSECTVGEVCVFRLIAATDTYWDTDNLANREIFFTYEGVSRGVGDLVVDYASPHPSWTAAYTIWDQGNYTFRIRGDCNSVLESTVLAEFKVMIREQRHALFDERGEDFDGKDENPEEDAARRVQELPLQSTPCDYGSFARWLKTKSTGKKGYKWTPFDCAPALEEPETFVKHLNNAGYTRMTLIGDSHQRVLYMHLKYLLAGHADASERRQHGDMSFTVRDGDQLLELRYYWVDGIYQNKEYGCHNRGMYSGRNDSFPDVEPGPGIYIFDAGTWTTASCAQPQLAYAKHLPEYLDWAETFSQEGSKLVWRTTPSWRGDCTRRNTVLGWTNKYAVPMVSARKDFQIFNSWEVEAPRYWDLCDWHYSCLQRDTEGTNRMVMKGDVGDAVTRNLMTWLVNMMK